MRACLSRDRDETAHDALSRLSLAPDELECFLPRRDLPRRALLLDELEQPSDLRARRQAQLVPSEQRRRRLALARTLDRGRCLLYT
jgi:hypothetical protein